MAEKKPFFNVTMYEMPNGPRYVVQGPKGELRATFPSSVAANIDEKRVNAAFNYGRENAQPKPRRIK